MNDERMVRNPFVSAMQGLKRRAEDAVDATPNMDAPTEAIGDGPAWTGSKAREVHDDYLAPNAGPVRTGLSELAADVQERIDEVDPEVPEGVARAMRVDLQMR